MEGLKSLTKSYFAMINIQSIKHQECVGEWESLTCERQSQLLDATIRHPRSQCRPPRLQYRINFIKFFISKLENVGVEVSDLLYDTLGSLMGQSSASEGEFCYKTYTLDDGQLLSIKESQQLVSQGTTGLRTWQAAQFLAEWAMENTDIFQDKCVLELGSGLGLTGLVIHTTCQLKNLILSDHHPSVLNLLTHNIDCNLNLSRNTAIENGDSSGHIDSHMWRPNNEHWTKLTKVSEVATRWENKHSPNIQVAALDWECLTGSEVNHLLGDVDVIVAADVVYDLSIIPALVGLLENLLKQGKSTKAYIASTVRNKATREQFIKTLDGQNIQYTLLAGPSKEVFFYDRSTAIELLQLQICSP